MSVLERFRSPRPKHLYERPILLACLGLVFNLAFLALAVWIVVKVLQHTGVLT